MAKGSKIVPVRIEEGLFKEMIDTIDEVNVHRRGEPYYVSTFIRAAIAEKIDHYKRSRAPWKKIKGYKIGTRRKPKEESDD